MLSVLFPYTDSDYSFGIFWPLCCLFLFDIWILITPLVFFGHCVVCSSSIYGFWLPLWYLLAIVLSVIIRYPDSDYPFGIFKLFLHKGTICGTVTTSILEQMSLLRLWWISSCTSYSYMSSVLFLWTIVCFSISFLYHYIVCFPLIYDFFWWPFWLLQTILPLAKKSLKVPKE